MINGIEYSWSKMVTTIAGIPIIGITAISYSDSQEKMNNWGAGDKVISRSYGKYEAEGKVKLYLSEVLAIQAASDTGNLTDIPPFTITVTYAKPDGTGTATDKLINCEFVGNGRDVAQGDTEGIQVEYDLIMSEIQWNN